MLSMPSAVEKVPEGAAVAFSFPILVGSTPTERWLEAPRPRAVMAVSSVETSRWGPAGAFAMGEGAADGERLGDSAHDVGDGEARSQGALSSVPVASNMPESPWMIWS